jgi:hypothetical protein
MTDDIQKRPSNNPTGVGGFTKGHKRSCGPRKTTRLKHLTYKAMCERLGDEMEIFENLLTLIKQSTNPREIIEFLKYLLPAPRDTVSLDSDDEQTAQLILGNMSKPFLVELQKLVLAEKKHVDGSTSIH